MPKRELIVRAIITQDECIIVNQGTHDQPNQFYYALPGGHVEADETCTEALQRELREELSVECSVEDLCFVIEHSYPGRRKNDAPRHELTLYFAATVRSLIGQIDGKISSPEAGKDFRWLPINAIRETAFLPEISREYLQKYFSGKPAPLYAFQDSSSEDSH